MLTSLLIPIVVATVALFFTSFLSWMILQLHRQDWTKMEKEDEFMAAARKCEIPLGSYMFPACGSPEEMKSEAFQAKVKAGPRGVMTIYAEVNMGKNLGLTFVYFLVCNFCLAYLTTLAKKPGDEFMEVFRFVSTAGLMTYLAAIVPHSIWFRCRIIGHILESIAFAAIVGAIFAAMWPKA
ncbi:MAG: Uncharacterized protein FD138_114 [Planctomycetota bacterium]|nr:MAG: Uncharacterized protein FD138_114 [Planctomycetota bacterium]